MIPFISESSNRESCPADDPPAVRFIVDTFPIEKRTELDSAAKSNDSSLLVDLIEVRITDNSTK